MALVVVTSTNGDFPVYFNEGNYPPALKNALGRIKKGESDKMDSFVVEMIMKVIIGEPGKNEFRGEVGGVASDIRFTNMHIVVADPRQKVSGYAKANVPAISPAPVVADFNVVSGHVVVTFGLIHDGRVRILPRTSICVFQHLEPAVQTFLNARNHEIKPPLLRKEQDVVLDWCFDELAKNPEKIDPDRHFASIFCFEIHVADRMLNAKHKGLLANLLAGTYFS